MYIEAIADFLYTRSNGDAIFNNLMLPLKDRGVEWYSHPTLIFFRIIFENYKLFSLKQKAYPKKPKLEHYICVPLIEPHLTFTPLLADNGGRE